jgi:hypothetical protein
MRKILPLFCILSITISAKAQFFSRNWTEGAYYDSVGIKHDGLIAWEAPQSSIFTGKLDYIRFKPKKDADGLKIYAQGFKSFVLGEDSFAVSKSALLAKNPFLKVLINNNDTTKLYVYLIAKKMNVGGIAGSFGMFTAGLGLSLKYFSSTYYYGTNPDNLTKLDKKQFIEVMTRIMADKPEAVKRIKDKKLRYGDMEDLLYFYKYDVMPPAQAPDPFSGSNN